MIKSVVFDFGGVLAEEGFRAGLKAIAEKNNLDPDGFTALSETLIDQTGYLTGKTDESHYWDAIRKKTGIRGNNRELRDEITNRFIIRPRMLSLVETLKASHLIVAMLSDQTNWLEEINNKTSLYNYFDHVYNSFRLGKSKKDTSVFIDICMDMGFKPLEVLFIDDRIGNIKNAEAAGLKTIHFIKIERTIQEVGKLIL